MYKHIRTIFSVFALTMIVVFALRVSADAWTPVNWGMLVIAALVCVLVFRCFLYIFNFSYALACALNGTLIIVAVQSPAAYVLGGIMVAYGLRLLWFTWTRTNSASYAPRVENIQKEDAKMPAPVKFALWLQCTFLYTFHLFGIYLAAQREVLTPSVLSGAAVILLGLVIEALADAQKQAGKAVNPDTFVRTGLFARWRHPNYIGEILVQTGIMVAGIGAVAATWGNLLAVMLSPLYIVLLMLAECLRADDYMELRYGGDEDFRAYRAQSGSFLPRL